MGRPRVLKVTKYFNFAQKNYLWDQAILGRQGGGGDFQGCMKLLRGGEMFEGDFADMCGEQFLLMLWGEE